MTPTDPLELHRQTLYEARMAYHDAVARILLTVFNDLGIRISETKADDLAREIVRW